MDSQEVAVMDVEGGRRCNESDLRKILLDVPIIIVRSRGSRLRVNVGLGNIVYIRPSKGVIKDVKLGNDVYEDENALKREGYVGFNYKGRMFDVSFN
jgi:hypothetical protein